MKKLTGVIITALLLTGCSQGEPVELKMPYNVETAKESCITEAKVVEPLQKVAKPTPESCRIEIAEAVIATPEPTPEPVAETPTPEPEMPSEVILEPVELISEPEPIPEPESVVEYVEPDPDPVEVVEVVEEMPTPADEFAYVDHSFLGTYTVTWYSREAVGYDAPGASGNGLVPYYSCAMPDYGLLNCTVLVKGYGYFHVDDVSDGPCDLYVMYDSEIPSYGMDIANVYIVG